METGFPVQVVHRKAGDQQAGQRRQYQQRETQIVDDEIQIHLKLAAGQPTAEHHLFGQRSSEPGDHQHQRRRERCAAGRQHDLAGTPLVRFAIGPSKQNSHANPRCGGQRQYRDQSDDPLKHGQHLRIIVRLPSIVWRTQCPI